MNIINAAHGTSAYQSLDTAPVKNLYPSLDITIPLITPSTTKALSYNPEETIAQRVEAHNHYLAEHPEHNIRYSPTDLYQQKDQAVAYKAAVVKTPTFTTKRELQGNITALTRFTAQCIEGFHPWDTTGNHPIHKELSEICKSLLEEKKGWGLNEKCGFICNAINELISAATGDSQKQELLDIALRFHFFQLLIASESDTIKAYFNHHGSFPTGLHDSENLLLNTLTNYARYAISPYIDVIKQFIGDLIPRFVDPIVKTMPTTLADCEKVIQEKLQHLQPSHSAKAIEYALRHAIEQRIIPHLAAQFKAQFEERGTITEAEMGTTSQKLELISKIFGLPPREAFQTVRDRLVAENTTKLASLEIPHKKKGLLSLFRPSQKQSSEQLKQAIETLWGKKQMTLDWIQRVWEEAYFPRAPYTPPPPYNPEVITAPIPVKSVDAAPATAQPAAQPVVSLQPTVSSTPPANAFVATPTPTETKYPPLISYLNLAFPELKEKPDAEKWSALPLINQRDVLRHVVTWSPTTCQGNVEEAARRIFNHDGIKMHKERDRLDALPLTSPEKALSEDFRVKGEAFLYAYYTRLPGYQAVRDGFAALPNKPTLLYKYIYEMAKEAKIPIADWDHNWAAHHWHEYIYLSIQALERCLHTEKRA